MKLQFRDKPQCTFWNFQLTNYSTEGCTPDPYNSNRTHTICECEHLTDFLAIVDITHREVPTLAKSILTYICSTITCVFLVASIIVALKYNRERYTLMDDQFSVKSNRFYLSLSIAVWLLVSHLLIMFGLDLTNSAALCDINSLLLLFTLLTTFSFMLMFSIHLYMCTSSTNLFRHLSFRKYAIVAYSIPIGVILLSLIVIFFTEANLDFVELFNSLRGEYL